MRVTRGVFKRLLNPPTVILAIFVVAVVCCAWRINKLYFARGIGVVEFCPGNAINLDAELREALWGTSEDVPIGSPPPEKYVLFPLSSNFQIINGNRDRFTLDSSFRTKHEADSFRLRQFLKTKTPLWITSSHGYIPLSDRSLCWRSTAIRDGKEKIHASQFFPVALGNLYNPQYSGMSKEGPLRNYGGLIRPIAYFPQQAAKDHKYGSGERSPSRSPTGKKRYSKTIS
jgi:hypothetical protein